MRIGFDGRYGGDHFPGIGRYSAGLLRALVELPGEHTLVLIVDPRAPAGRYDLASLARLPRVELAPLAASPFGPGQQLALPALARRRRLDLLHSPYLVKPYLGLPCPSAVTIYDLIGRRFPATLSWRGRLLLRATLGMAVRTADAILTISESARADLAQFYPAARGRLAVTPLAADEAFRPQPAEAVAAARARHELPERYVLYLGSNKPHKNLGGLVAAWRLARAQAPGAALVIAGHQDARHPVVGAGEERVLLRPNVADADLPALYGGAELFAFPSLYEGFGLPPLEAMACGAPVLCANRASLPEVVGDAALLVDPLDTGAIAAGLVRLLGDAALRGELRARGLRRAAAFSWRRTAELTLGAYARVAR
jgi:glycosyltransferase involved in cell wall biosynthesis